MSKARIYAKNIFANWVGYGANLLVMFFMSPFVVHQLGDVNYGVWTLMLSFTGYLGLVEMGTRAGLGRFINYYLGKDDIPRVNGVINTALAIFLAAGGVLLIASIILAVLLPTIFAKIPADLIPSARVVLFLIAVNLWISFLSAAFRLLLEAHERFELRSGIDTGVILIRTGLAIAALLAGKGLVALAIIQTTTNLLGLIAGYALARKVFPRLQLRSKLVSRQRFRELFGFSIWAFIGSLGGRLLHQADPLVIALLLGPRWITYYVIASNLVYKCWDMVGLVTGVFRPTMIQACGRTDLSSLRIDFRRSSDLSMAIGIPLLVGMVVFGGEFIVLWMGSKFAISHTILMILAISSFPGLALGAGGAIFAGLNKVRLDSMLVISQGVVNLALTLVLVITFHMGIEGVAWGTFFPRILFGMLPPILVAGWIHLPLRQLLFRSIARWILATVIFLAICLGLSSIPFASTWPMFLTKTLLALGLYAPLAFFVVIDPQDRRRTLDALRRRFGKNQALVQVEVPKSD